MEVGKSPPLQLQRACEKEVQQHLVNESSNEASIVAQKINKEWEDLRNNPIPHYSNVGPIMKQDLLNWEATIQGPMDSPYAGGMFKLLIRFPTDYPLTPPTFCFATRIYHCNILADGSICGSDVHEELEYNSALGVGFLLVYVYDLLKYPSPCNTQQGERVKMWLSDRSRYYNIARTWTRIHAMDFDESKSSKFTSPMVSLLSSSASTFGYFRKPYLSTNSTATDIYTAISEKSDVVSDIILENLESMDWSTTKLTKKCVRFCNLKRVRMIPHIHSFSDEMIEEIWFGRPDLEASKKSSICIAFMMDMDSSDLDRVEEYESARGLESETKKGKLQRFKHIQEAYDAVLYEQERQRIEGVEDEQIISQLYRASNNKCIEVALANAEGDEKAIEEYVADTRWMLQNCFSCGKL